MTNDLHVDDQEIVRQWSRDDRPGKFWFAEKGCWYEFARVEIKYRREARDLGGCSAQVRFYDIVRAGPVWRSDLLLHEYKRALPAAHLNDPIAGVWGVNIKRIKMWVATPLGEFYLEGAAYSWEFNGETECMDILSTSIAHLSSR